MTRSTYKQFAQQIYINQAVHLGLDGVDLLHKPLVDVIGPDLGLALLYPQNARRLLDHMAVLVAQNDQFFQKVPFMPDYFLWEIEPNAIKTYFRWTLPERLEVVRSLFCQGSVTGFWRRGRPSPDGSPSTLCTQSHRSWLTTRWHLKIFKKSW